MQAPTQAATDQVTLVVTVDRGTADRLADVLRDRALVLRQQAAHAAMDGAISDGPAQERYEAIRDRLSRVSVDLEGIQRAVQAAVLR